MKYLICPDSFKGSLSAMEVALAIKESIEKTDKNAEFTLLPLADGGEGTMEVLVNALRGEVFRADVCGPLFEDRKGPYGIIGDSIVAESASCVGLPLVPKNMRNPLNTSTYGVGLTIKEALKKGKQHIILTIGGVATNDCGIGAFSALGVRFLNREGREVCPTGKGLGEIETIDISNINPQAKKAKWTILCDVDNLLYGERGAARVFGPQKGATPEIVEILEKNVIHFAEIVKRDFGVDLSKMKHGGAAGGFAAGLSVFFDTEIVSGTDYILDLVDFEKMTKEADCIITGEGRVDSQTLEGKIISGILKYNKPVYVLGGSVTHEGYELVNHGAVGVYSISEGHSVEYSMTHTKELIEETILKQGGFAHRNDGE